MTHRLSVTANHLHLLWRETTLLDDGQGRLGKEHPQGMIQPTHPVQFIGAGFIQGKHLLAQGGRIGGHMGCHHLRRGHAAVGAQQNGIYGIGRGSGEKTNGIHSIVGGRIHGWFNAPK